MKKDIFPLSSLIRLTFKQRLSMVLLLLSIVPVLVIGFYSASMFTAKIQEEIDINQQMTLMQLQYQVDTMLYDLESVSLQITSDIAIEKSLKYGISMEDPVALQAVLDMKERLTNYRTFAGIDFDVSLVYTKFGYLYSNKYGVVKIRDYPYNLLIQDKNVPLTGSLVVPPNVYENQKSLLLIRTIHGNSMAPEGQLVMEIDAKRFYEFFQSLNIGNSSKVMIVDNEGRIAMSQLEGEVGSRVDSLSPIYRIWQGIEENRDVIKIGDTDYKASTLQSSFNRWTYIALTPTQVLTAKSKDIKQITWTVVLIMIGGWSVLSIILSHRMYTPLHRVYSRLPVTGKYKDALQEIDSYIVDSKQSLHRLSDQLQSQESDVREYVLLKMLHGKLSNQESYDLLSELQFPVKGSTYHVGLATTDDSDSFMKELSGKDRDQKLSALCRLIEETGKPFFPCLALSSESGTVAFIFSVNDTEDDTERKVSDFGLFLREKIAQYLHLSVTIAISGACANVQRIDECYREATKLMHMRFWFGKEQVITAFEINDWSRIQLGENLTITRKKAILKYLKEGDLNEAESEMNHLLDELQAKDDLFPTAVHFIYHLLGEITMAMGETGNELQRQFQQNLYYQLFKLNSMNELKQWFDQQFFPTIRHYLGKIDGMQRKNLVQQVIAYLEKNYETDLSLQQVAEHFGIQDYQLSRYLKEHTGVTFIEYVISLRMSKAKQWLAHSEMSIKEMTERLRYTTTQNFSRVFKQITGISPGRFRNVYKQGYEEI